MRIQTQMQILINMQISMQMQN
uniref:Uncharacterized protein n=1 Tax=Solanum lycopersicum TaxID=4081 RepID=A0A3Q7ITY7_SOLLC